MRPTVSSSVEPKGKFYISFFIYLIIIDVPATVFGYFSISTF